LVPCCLIFIVKDRKLALTLLNSMLKFWPFASSDKEKLFLSEIKEVIEVIDPAFLKPIIK
jgi:serine/threonine-protein phosphatase 2A regulatory subunit B'